MKQEHWRDLGASEKTKLALSIVLIIASIILGFVSFIMLYEVPGSVIGINGVWCSTSLALLGITAYVNTEIVKMHTRVNEKLDELDEAEKRHQISEKENILEDE